ncbi:hypothetical protein [uncultured Tessaracoccus sp.]|uniref:hypothetical protein n=1 Tax=uncultured Tessaracoccus sp. TaxID=905023 RepID=UPI00260AAA80|nr:hypothetical protein [uncultured Tessaracoccus sp.]
MTIKTIASITSAAALALGVTACGADEDNASGSTPTSEPTVTVTETPNEAEDASTSTNTEPAPSTDEESSESAPESTGDSPQTSDGSNVNHEDQKEQQAHGDAKFTFNYVTVEVSQPDNPPKQIDGLSGIYAETCVTKLPDEFKDKGKMPVNASAWKHELVPSGTELKRKTSGGYKPAYPETAELAPGECVSGFLSFEMTNEEIDGILVSYDNSLGAHARWSFD